MQQQFLAQYVPTVWKILPAFEEFMEKWGDISRDPDYAALRGAIQCGIKTLEKYYNKADNSPVQIVNLCTACSN